MYFVAINEVSNGLNINKTIQSLKWKSGLAGHGERMMTKHNSRSKDSTAKHFVMKPLAGAIIGALSASVAMAQESEAVTEQERLTH